jgi:Leucine-rich repeat (LRR) protein
MTFKQWLINNPQDINICEIDCSSSKLTDLNGLEQFTKLIKLNCKYNDLKELPDLPNCVNLNCKFNKLEKLPELPECKILICGNNELKELPDLPNCVQLHCDYKVPKYYLLLEPDHFKLDKLSKLPKCEV